MNIYLAYLYFKLVLCSNGAFYFSLNGLREKYFILYYQLNCSLLYHHIRSDSAPPPSPFSFKVSEMAAICCRFWWHPKIYRNIWAVFYTYDSNGHQMVYQPHRLNFLSKTRSFLCLELFDILCACLSVSCPFSPEACSIQVSRWLFFQLYKILQDWKCVVCEVADRPICYGICSPLCPTGFFTLCPWPACIDIYLDWNADWPMWETVFFLSLIQSVHKISCKVDIKIIPFKRLFTVVEEQFLVIPILFFF